MTRVAVAAATRRSRRRAVSFVLGHASGRFAGRRRVTNTKPAASEP